MLIYRLDWTVVSEICTLINRLIGTAISWVIWTVIAGLTWILAEFDGDILALGWFAHWFLGTFRWWFLELFGRGFLGWFMHWFLEWLGLGGCQVLWIPTILNAWVWADLKVDLGAILSDISTGISTSMPEIFGATCIVSYDLSVDSEDISSNIYFDGDCSMKEVGM